MKKDKPNVKLIDSTEIIEEDESLDYSNSVSETLATFRNLYLDIVCEDDEDDIENLKLSYELERELRHAIYDSGERIHVFLHLYLENLFSTEVSPYKSSWIRFFSDDDMRINAYRILSAIQYDVTKMLFEIVETKQKEKNDEQEE
tara:strand:+ start:288 stop:722 length:435 start_codon:yes stop_codon:yes gene_type:complete